MYCLDCLYRYIKRHIVNINLPLQRVPITLVIRLG
jgi:hypothetical protein